MALETLPFDVLDYLSSDEDLAFLLKDALETSDGAYIDDVVATIERARTLDGQGLNATARLVRVAQLVGYRLDAIEDLGTNKAA